MGYCVQLRTVTVRQIIMTNSTDNHGLDQAKAQAESIAAMVAAINCDYDRLQELRDEREALTDEIDGICTASAYGLEKEKAAREALAAWDAENAAELQALEIEAGECADSDEAREIVQNDPLSVEVRSGWDIVGGDLSAAEFRIVLCTGGPHVEIVGELDNGTPSRAWLQYQDWGTPMTRYFDIEQSTLLAYCQEFYFEG
jgi:hypothetical protein